MVGSQRFMALLLGALLIYMISCPMVIQDTRTFREARKSMRSS